MKKILFGFCLLGLVGTTNATVISFENGSQATEFSGNYSVISTPVSSNSGYDNVANFTNSTYVAFNSGGSSPTTFSWTGVGTFDLTSFVIAGAWGSQTLLFEGLYNNSIMQSLNYAVTDSASIFTANWFGLDAFRITIDPSGYIDSGTSGGGQHWALDNIAINENSSASVPEPASLALLGLGLAGIGFFRIKKSA